MFRKDAFAFLRKSAILPIPVEESFSFSMQELNEVSREIKGDVERPGSIDS